MIQTGPPAGGAYGPILALLSLLLAVGSAHVALDFAGRTALRRGAVRRLWLWGGAIAAGAGVAAIHYTGLAALPLAASLTFLWLAYRFRREGRATAARELASAALLGTAVAAAQGTALLALRYEPARGPRDLGWAVPLPSLAAVALAIAVLLALGLATTPVMLVSAVGQRGDASRGRELGVAAYLTKPLRRQVLRDAILAVLARPEGEELPPVTRHSLREAFGARPASG